MSRYIDAEILLDAMRHITLGETDVARSEMKIVHYICHMPHIDDIRENVRGEWIFPYGDKKYKRCSVCGSVFYSIPYNTNFCPNCGAEMKGER